MVTVGSVTREAAAARFPFLAAKVSGRRGQIKEFTHRDPDYVFWVHPDGRLHDAKRSHRDNVPRGHEGIEDDEPDYGGFLRGRIASLGSDQLVVVYCRPEALAVAGDKLRQFLRGLAQLPVPLDDRALVVSDNADLYGTVADLYRRAQEAEPSGRADGGA
ncbi:hypothetical protein [Tuwongella immobilis]|uniref:Uncharacterized protein n=1 Tax=Tuwongella immobilis TaxID=692036 RepID=A0A6C2YUF0_9BACT|nr:hypothetical protein [Tuwongella immobilis]VIP05368.1 unnamed protein product [Tuwongella immobilis]VTS08092.1 unnamed protein product [Tuwongella immobilis]